MPEQVLLLLILLIYQVISQEGIAPIPASELYGESFNLTHEQGSRKRLKITSNPTYNLSSRMPDFRGFQII